jgi:signal peptidase I
MLDENNDMDSGESAKVEATDSPTQLTRKQKIIKEAKSISLILLLVFTFRSSFFEPFRIPSGSMIPTLMIGDFILVNKFSYGFKVPFSDLSLGSINWSPIYIYGKSTPSRGDVIVFKYPEIPSMNYIKRVIAIPGDTIEIRNKVVYVNGERIETEEFDGEKIMADMDDSFRSFNLRFYKSHTGEEPHVIQIDRDNFFTVDYRKTIVPEQNYFVMGDNRDFSSDSRAWGFVPEENIKGKALFVWFSLIFPGGEHSFKFRPWRIGTKIK